MRRFMNNSDSVAAALYLNTLVRAVKAFCVMNRNEYSVFITHQLSDPRMAECLVFS